MSSETPGNLPHVLVVDDEESSRRIVETWLTRFGYKCTTCGDGLEALMRMDREPFGIVIMDWHMPGMDGIELVRLLRARAFAQAPYLVLTTGDPERSSMEQAFVAGVDEFLRKPIDPPELMARLHAARRVLDLENKVRERLQGQTALGLHRGVVRELSEVVGTLAHDLRTPLATLRVTSESLLPKVRNECPGILNAVKRMCRVAEAMSETLEDVVSAFIADDAVGGPWEVVDLSAEIRRAVEMVSASVPSFTSVSVPGEPFRIRGNPHSLKRLVMNLVANSLRHANCRSIGISVAPYGEREGWVMVDLRDDGVGIPLELLAHLGEPMLLSDASLRREFFAKGSGLGYVICRRVVAEHGGRMLVSTGKGKGTRVRIWLPTDLRAAAADTELASLETEVLP